MRQFELKVDDQLAKIEYSLQERKIFLTKLEIPEPINKDDFEEEKELIWSAGCDQIMRKPFLEEEIFEAMRKSLGVQYLYED